MYVLDSMLVIEMSQVLQTYLRGISTPSRIECHLMQQRLQEVRGCISIRYLYGANRSVVNSTWSTLVEVLDAMLVIVIYYNFCDITELNNG